MSNMSYCRFRNTYRDFRDCYEALQDGVDSLSAEELRAAVKLAKAAKEFVEDFYDELIEENEEEN